jgi:hypothetical protein
MIEYIFIFLGILFVISTIANIFLGFAVRGAIRDRKVIIENYTRTKLTGVLIEEIRRKLWLYGKNAITEYDILDLIYTIRDIQLGIYSDEDPYVPSDPYDGLNDEKNISYEG